mmetsp:Transcript_14369/g.24464  ORF Transcript_14369/g.24464 Transcript_14369/m.24464 type:complete len:104 (+) Transcript_14369:898-1209(+)
MKESIGKGEDTFRMAEGIDRKYLSIKDTKRAQFERNTDKPEASIVPEMDGSIKITRSPPKKEKIQPFSKAINGKFKPSTDEAPMPKVTFESQEVFGQAMHLCQ